MIIGIDIEEKLGLLEPVLQDYIANGPFQAWRSIKVADLQAAIERRRELLTRIYDERQEEADASPSSHGEARSNCDHEWIQIGYVKHCHLCGASERMSETEANEFEAARDE